jgi:hypothetical protein
MKCDVCNIDMKAIEGYVLTTSQVATSEAYWTHQIETLRRVFPRALGATELERQLPGRIQFVTFQTGAWLICEECSELFVFDRAIARPSPSPAAPDGDIRQARSEKLDQTDLDRCTVTAARAWERVFGQWPTAAVERPDWAVPTDSCDLCGKDLYSMDAVAFLSKEEVKNSLRQGFIDNGPVRPPRSRDGRSGWFLCMSCVARSVARRSRPPSGGA